MTGNKVECEDLEIAQDKWFATNLIIEGENGWKAWVVLHGLVHGKALTWPRFRQ